MSIESNFKAIAETQKSILEVLTRMADHLEGMAANPPAANQVLDPVEHTPFTHSPVVDTATAFAGAPAPGGPGPGALANPAGPQVPPGEDAHNLPLLSLEEVNNRIADWCEVEPNQQSSREQNVMGVLTHMGLSGLGAANNDQLHEVLQRITHAAMNMGVPGP